MKKENLELKDLGIETKNKEKFLKAVMGEPEPKIERGKRESYEITDILHRRMGNYNIYFIMAETKRSIDEDIKDELRMREGGVIDDKIIIKERIIGRKDYKTGTEVKGTDLKGKEIKEIGKYREYFIMYRCARRREEIEKDLKIIRKMHLEQGISKEETEMIVEMNRKEWEKDTYIY